MFIFQIKNKINIFQKAGKSDVLAIYISIYVFLSFDLFLFTNIFWFVDLPFGFLVYRFKSSFLVLKIN